MESTRDRLITEIDKIPASFLQEILDFVLFVNPRYSPSKLATNAVTNKGWHPGFFEEVIGGWEGERLVRDSQPDYELREELL